ncbi:MAG: reverse transcriptase-like protein, partial [Candidatus Micrarchaeota archaeon]|nr:reverse transcriptase-like protein [Candidatus Micrarchaeota archaeon]
HIRSDSELMVKQLTGKYKVKDIKLKVLYGKALRLCEGLDVTFEHIPREKNELADELSKRAIETYLNKKEQ